MLPFQSSLRRPVPAACSTGVIVRARWDPLSSYHISFLLWPDSERWPQDGEIDYPETNMGSREVSAFMHRMNGTSGSDQVEYDVLSDPQQWHTYEIAWLPGSLSFYLDGHLIGRSTNDIPSTPMHWVLQTNTSPTVGPGGTQSGDLQIDWAVAYVPTS
jgi:beta-glucanase (GH16 family)